MCRIKMKSENCAEGTPSGQNAECNFFSFSECVLFRNVLQSCFSSLITLSIKTMKRTEMSSERFS